MVSLLTALQEYPHKKERNKKVLKRNKLERLNSTNKVWRLLITLQLAQWPPFRLYQNIKQVDNGLQSERCQLECPNEELMLKTSASLTNYSTYFTK